MYMHRLGWRQFLEDSEMSGYRRQHREVLNQWSKILFYSPSIVATLNASTVWIHSVAANKSTDDAICDTRESLAWRPHGIQSCQQNTKTACDDG